MEISSREDSILGLLGEWLSGKRRYFENRKDPGSNPARCSAGLWDSTSLRGSQRLSGRTGIKYSDSHRVGEAAPSTVAQSWPWGSQIAVEKKLPFLLECEQVFLGANQIPEFFDHQ